MDRHINYNANYNGSYNGNVTTPNWNQCYGFLPETNSPEHFQRYDAPPERPFHSFSPQPTSAMPNSAPFVAGGFANGQWNYPICSVQSHGSVLPMYDVGHQSYMPEAELLTTVDDEVSTQHSFPHSTVDDVDPFQKRTIFTKMQLVKLEERFLLQSFLSKEERQELAQQLGLTDRQVMIWFQNRRSRLKKRGPSDKAFHIKHRQNQEFMEQLKNSDRAFPFFERAQQQARGSPFHSGELKE